MVLKGRLGLETARIPHVDRHGLLWLSRGRLVVRAGTLHFITAGSDLLPAGAYDLPYQTISCLLLGPGTTVSHDALRLLASHGTGLVMVGEHGLRMYASMPFGPDDSALARAQTRLWSEQSTRLHVARRMYARRLGEMMPNASIEVLRGLEGTRMKQTYRLLAEQYGVSWKGRRYDRGDPESADRPNQAINHAATTVQAAAMVAVASTGTIPQLGFIHEDSGIAFALDIADLHRDSVTIPLAFSAVREARRRQDRTLDRIVRQMAGKVFQQQKLIPAMITTIKELLDADDGDRNP